MSICIIGAGFSGICVAIQLKRKLNTTDFIIFDQNSEVGGTWFINTYPGTACDIPAHLYSYSFEPKSDWSSVYASQIEILDYLKNVCSKYSLYDHIRFRNNVKTLTWLESHKRWKAVTVNLDTNTVKECLYSIVIVATGQFHTPNIPEQFLNFKGPIIHTAQWDHSIDLSDKIVGIIGSGASAVQLIPEIVGKVKKLISYQRRPPFVIPKYQFKYNKFLKWCYAKVPGFRSAYRTFLFLLNETNHTAFQRGTVLGSFGKIIGSYLGKVNLYSQTDEDNVDLRNSIFPKEIFGCTRPCLSNEYYIALCQPNVTVIPHKIFRVTHNSVITEGGDTRQLDVLVLATGFRVEDYFAPLKIFGDSNEDMLELWKSNGPPRGILGTFFQNMPNMFFIHGPGSDIGHNSGIFVFERQTEMIIKVLREMDNKNAKRVSVNSSCVVDSMKKTKILLDRMVWTDPECKHETTHLMYPKTLISMWLEAKLLNVQKLFRLE